MFKCINCKWKGEETAVKTPFSSIPTGNCPVCGDSVNKIENEKKIETNLVLDITGDDVVDYNDARLASKVMNEVKNVVKKKRATRRRRKV